MPSLVVVFAFYPVRLQHTIDPEAVKPGFLNAHDRKLIARTRSHLFLELSKSIQQCGHITATHRVFRHLLTIS